MPLDGFIDTQPYFGEEVVLHLQGDRGWTQEQWTDLAVYGYTPLRLLTTTSVVVWKHEVNAQHPVALEMSTPSVVWSSLPVDGQQVRVVFEPNLPKSVQDWIVEEFHNMHPSPHLSIDRGHLSSVTMVWSTDYQTSWFDNRHGILTVEPLLETESRTLASAKKLAGSGERTYPLAWTFGLNGSGVVVGVADTGIDSDHSCFRNISSSSIGYEHRKLLHVNTTIDDWDSSGHADYRHGTHTAGILGCHPVDTATGNVAPSAMMALGYDTRLVVQDIVSDDGWVPPDVDLLLAESAMYGGFIHSNSWGDDTTDYTLRSGDFDAFTREFPWTLPLIAPGNNGERVLEPANARNVVAVGASTKDDVTERWVGSVHGPTDSDTRGIFALAPGASIVSARSDGVPDSYNSGQHTLSGTSMSTPMAASYASVVQQMVQEGWITGHNETLGAHDLQLRVPWFETDSIQRNVLLGEGFTPSAPMMKALLSLSTTPLAEPFRNGGSDGSIAPNNHDGWGVLNLSELIDFDGLSASSESIERPIQNVWIHDSFRLSDSSPVDVLNARKENATPIEYLMQNSWDGDGAVGPFLSTGDAFQQRFILQKNMSLDVHLSFQAKPEPHLVDDIQLMIRLPDGRFAVGEQYRQDGRSMLFYDFADHLNTTAFPASNETTVGIHLDATTLEDVDYVDVVVTGRYVTPGNEPGTLGVNGDRVGFGLAIRGVEIDPLNHSDGDNDSIPYEQDSCPFTNALGWDENQDGCIDDLDNDGIDDNIDSCPTTALNVPVTATGCAQQNNAPRVFVDESLLQTHQNQTITIMFSVLDDDDVATEVSLQREGGAPGTVPVCSVLVENNSWNVCTVDVEADFFPLSAEGQWYATLIAQDLNSSLWTTAMSTTYRSNVFEIHLPPSTSDVEARQVSSSLYLAVATSIGLAMVLAFVFQRWLSEDDT